MRVGGSTPPDNTRLTCRGRVLRDVAFPNSICRSQRWIKVFNSSFGFSDCNSMYDLFANKPSYRLHPRGQAPRHSPCFSVEDEGDDNLSGIKCSSFKRCVTSVCEGIAAVRTPQPGTAVPGVDGGFTAIRTRSFFPSVLTAVIDHAIERLWPKHY